MSAVNSKFTRILAVALLAASLSAATRAQEVSQPVSSEHKVGQKLFVPGLPNLGGVTPNLFRGAQPSQEGLSALAKMGVVIVINLRGDRESERDEVTKLGMQYITIPMHCGHMTHEDLAAVLRILRDNQDKKIFIHCQFGVDRTGMTIAAYRMVEQGWTADESLREMEAFGYSLKHKMACPGLTAFETNFPDAYANNSAFENLRPAPVSSATKDQLPAPAKE